MYNPETALLKKTGAIEKVPEKSENKLYNWYQQDKSLRKEREERIKFLDMDDFHDVYPPEKIRKDKQWVITQRQRGKEIDMAQEAELLEMILSKFSDRAQWFGEMTAFRTLEFDDRRNGVDIVLEGKTEDENPVYIAIDCTISQSQQTIDEKVDKITRGIEKDTLSQVEYFLSDDGEYKGRIGNIPKVILAVAPERMEELCFDCLPAIQKKYDTLSNSHFQIFFLCQLESQLEKQRQLINLPKEDLSRHKKEVVEAIENALSYVRGIMKEKENSLNREAIQRGTEEYETSGLGTALTV